MELVDKNWEQMQKEIDEGGDRQVTIYAIWLIDDHNNTRTLYDLSYDPNIASEKAIYLCHKNNFVNVWWEVTPLDNDKNVIFKYGKPK